MYQIECDDRLVMREISFFLPDGFSIPCKNFSKSFVFSLGKVFSPLATVRLRHNSVTTISVLNKLFRPYDTWQSFAERQKPIF